MDILNFRKKWLASEHWPIQAIGALLKWYNLIMLVVVISIISFLRLDSGTGKLLQLAALFLSGIMTISVCRTLTDIFSLRKQESRITMCQIIILLTVGLMIIGVVIITDLQNHPRFATALAIVGSVLTWIFQDTIKGVAAFLNLRLNHLLNIGDWIKVPQYNVDGAVRKVSLTTITVYNWDTTTSSIPTSVLTTNHYMNLQHMMEGKTFGRQMTKTFIFDQNWIHTLSQAEVNKLSDHPEVTKYLSKDEIAQDTLNIRLFRLYLLHWLMKHSHISQHPRLLVSWLEPVEAGLPLQVRAFIIDSKLAAFEWQQSQIIEHIVESLGWFGLRLYQSPSSYDVSNSNIHLTDKAATYRNE